MMIGFGGAYFSLPRRVKLALKEASIWTDTLEWTDTLDATDDRIEL